MQAVYIIFMKFSFLFSFAVYINVYIFCAILWLSTVKEVL